VSFLPFPLAFPHVFGNYQENEKMSFLRKLFHLVEALGEINLLLPACFGLEKLPMCLSISTLLFNNALT
jgi:hypothetical protein